jgi:hypothetical protein
MSEFSDAEIARAVAAYKAHGSERAAARAIGQSKTWIHNRVKAGALRGDLGFKPVLPGFEIKRTSAQLDAGGEVQKEWVTQHQASGPAFKMPPGQILKGVSAFVDADGNIRHQWIKTKNESAISDLIPALLETFKSYRGRSQLVPPPRRVDRDILSVYPIADPHIGMLSWRPQTGADYDLKIAIERLLDCAATLVARADRSRESLIVNLGDWYHANDQRNITPRSGHQLDVDGRWYKVLQAGVKTMMRIIDLNLAKHERVEVVNIPGNHDPEAACAQALALSTFYANNKRVKIAFPSDIYYRQFGRTLIGAAHGDKMPPARMAMAMATDQREAWGQTAYHWFMFGHIHTDSLKTIGDVRCESFSTIADKDNHASGGGWRSAQALKVVTLHKRGGEANRAQVNILPPSMR